MSSGDSDAGDVHGVCKKAVVKPTHVEHGYV